MSWQNNLKRFTEKQGEKYLLKKAEEVRTEAAINSPVRTGALQSSISLVPVSKTKVRVGSSLFYAWWVEMGTSKMAPRANIRRALRKEIK